MSDTEFINNQLQYLRNFCKLHERVKGIGESIYELQPIAVVKENRFFLFAPNNKDYNFVTEHPTPFPIDFEIYAAFPLSFYQNEIAAIVTEAGLKEEKNHVFVLHEFVHCFQWNTCEEQLRSELAIEQEQMIKGVFDWEIKYPFPYEDDTFVRLTNELGCSSNFQDYHAQLRKYLRKTDYEYLVWQEWKEGFAQYIENLIRQKLGMKLDNISLSPPFDRVSFYETGSRYIDYLISNDSSLFLDLHELFNTMFNHTK